MGNQKCHFVCLACRRSIKRAVGHQDWQWNRDENGGEFVAPAPVDCAQCRATMFCAGRYFAAPKRRDDAGWKKLAWMIENGWKRNYRRGDDWPTSPAMNLNEVRESLRARDETVRAKVARAKQERSFEEARRNARWNFRRSHVARRQEQRELARQRKYQNAVLARVKDAEN